jgi:hypothetical protein
VWLDLVFLGVFVAFGFLPFVVFLAMCFFLLLPFLDFLLYRGEVCGVDDALEVVGVYAVFPSEVDDSLEVVGVYAVFPSDLGSLHSNEMGLFCAGILASICANGRAKSTLLMLRNRYFPA